MIVGAVVELAGLLIPQIPHIYINSFLIILHTSCCMILLYVTVYRDTDREQQIIEREERETAADGGEVNSSLFLLNTNTNY